MIGDHDNAPVIKIHVGKNTQIKAYAKTTGTVRFEITHAQRAGDIGTFTAGDDDGLFRWIDRAAAGATTRLNALLAALGQTLSDTPINQYQPQRLLYDLYSVYKDWPKTLERLSILINAGKIEARKSSPLSAEVKLLVRSKIIKRVSPRNAEIRIFHVSDRYRSALASFRACL